MIRKIILRTLAVFVLTVISQVGGIIYLCCLASYPFIDKKISGWLWRGLVKFSFFITIYVISIFTVIPLLAKQFGRVRLPILENNHVKPLLAMTWILNRNYVTPNCVVRSLKVLSNKTTYFQARPLFTSMPTSHSGMAFLFSLI